MPIHNTSNFLDILGKWIKSEMLLEVIIITGIYFDGFQSIITPIVHLLVLAFFIYRLLSKSKSGFNLSKRLALELRLFLIFFLYIILSSHFLCCSSDNLRRIFRFSMSMIIFYVYATSKKPAYKLNKYILTFSWLNIVTFLISLLGLINQEAWNNLWRIILDQRSAMVQFFEISRGRISVISPVHMTFMVPLSYFFYKTHKNRLLGIISFVSGILTILLLGYRNYVVSSGLGLFILFVLIVKYLKRRTGIVYASNILKLCTCIIISCFMIYILSARFFLEVTILDRFTNKYAIDRESLTARWNLMLKAMELFKSSPLVGIGAGNYRQYTFPILIYPTNPQGIVLNKALYTYSPEAHNIFLDFLSETGIMGILIIGFILTNFANNDIKLLKIMRVKNRGFNNLANITVIIVSSWMFIIGGMLDTYSRTSLNLFFAFRGILSSFLNGEVVMSKKLIA